MSPPVLGRSMSASRLRLAPTVFTNAPTFVAPTATSNLAQVASITNNVAKYMLSLYPYSGSGFNPGANNDVAVRQPGDAMYAVAAAIATGVYDPAATGITLATAKTQILRVINGLANSHFANGSTWGGTAGVPQSNDTDGTANWQVSLWAFRVVASGWLMQGDLSAAQQALYINVAVWEAERVVDWVIPYWRNLAGTELYAGDTKFEEVTWAGGMLLLAYLVAPTHPRAVAWLNKGIQIAMLAAVRPVEVTDTTNYNGFNISALVNGTNVNNDGTVINHNIMTPDYPMASMQWQMAPLFTAAGMKLPLALQRGAAVNYQALSSRVFVTGEAIVGGNNAAAPGGTIYKNDGTGLLYYPNGSDWGPGLIQSITNADVLASIHGWDSGLPIPARAWASLHMQKWMDQQARDITGQTYQTPEENTSPGRENVIAYYAAVMCLAYYAGAPLTSNSDVPTLALANQTPYTRSAVNDTAGNTDVTAPTAPTIGTATTAGVASASVAFTGSTDAVLVTRYRLYSSVDSYTAVIATAINTPIGVKGLTGVAQTFKVTAFDGINESAMSAASNSITPTAQPSFVGYSSSNDSTTTGTAHTGPAAPTGTAVGDLLLLEINAGASADTLTVTGWTQIGTKVSSLSIWQRVATLTSDDAPAATLSASGNFSATTRAYRRAQVASFAQNAEGSSTPNHQTPSVTTSAANDIVVSVIGSSSTTAAVTYTWPSPVINVSTQNTTPATSGGGGKVTQGGDQVVPVAATAIAPLITSSPSRSGGTYNVVLTGN